MTEKRSAARVEAPPPVCRYFPYPFRCPPPHAHLLPLAPGHLVTTATAITFLSSGSTGATRWTAPLCNATRVTIATGIRTTALSRRVAGAIGGSRRGLVRGEKGVTSQRTHRRTPIIGPCPKTTRQQRTGTAGHTNPRGTSPPHA